MPEKPYQPSPKEVERAEEMMTETEREVTEKREQSLRAKETHAEAMPLRTFKARMEQKETTRNNFITPDDVVSSYRDKAGEPLVYFDEEEGKVLESVLVSEEFLDALNIFGIRDPETNRILTNAEAFIFFPGGFRLMKTGERPTFRDLQTILDPKLFRHVTDYLDKDTLAKETLPLRWFAMPKQAVFLNQNWYQELGSVSGIPEAEVRKKYAELLGLPETSAAGTLAEAFLNRFKNGKKRLSQGDARIQEELLKNADYEVAPMLAELFKLEFVQKKTGEHLNPKAYARTRNLDAYGYRVYVGYFESDGLHVDNDWDGRADSGVGLSVSRKFKK